MSIIELIERRANRAHAEAHGLTLIEDLSPAEQKAIHDDMEAKARYVRTAAGVARFKRPIGAIILPRGLGSLDRIRIKDPVFKGFDLVEDRKGNLYDVGKDDSTGKYVALKHNTWDDQIKPADSLDDALAALNEKLGGGTNSDREEGETPAPKAKKPAPKKAPAGGDDNLAGLTDDDFTTRASALRRLARLTGLSYADAESQYGDRLEKGHNSNTVTRRSVNALARELEKPSSDSKPQGDAPSKSNTSTAEIVDGKFVITTPDGKKHTRTATGKKPYTHALIRKNKTGSGSEAYFVSFATDEGKVRRESRIGAADRAHNEIIELPTSGNDAPSTPEPKSKDETPPSTRRQERLFQDAHKKFVESGYKDEDAFTKMQEVIERRASLLRNGALEREVPQDEMRARLERDRATLRDASAQRDGFKDHADAQKAEAKFSKPIRDLESSFKEAHERLRKTSSLADYRAMKANVEKRKELIAGENGLTASTARAVADRIRVDDATVRDWSDLERRATAPKKTPDAPAKKGRKVPAEGMGNNIGGGTVGQEYPLATMENVREAGGKKSFLDLHHATFGARKATKDELAALPDDEFIAAVNDIERNGTGPAAAVRKHKGTGKGQAAPAKSGGTMGGQGSKERDAFIESHPKLKGVNDYHKPKLRDLSEKNFQAYVDAVEGGKSPDSIGAIMSRVDPGASWNPTTEKWSGQNSKGRPTSPTPTGDTSASDAADAAARKRVQQMRDEERAKGRTNPYTSSLAPYQRDQVNALTPGEYAKYMNARDAGETHRSAHSTAKGGEAPSKPKTREAELEESREIMKMHETANYARRPFVRAENDFTGTANMIDNGKLKTKRQAENAIKNLEKNIAKREAMMADKTRLDELLARDVEARQRHLRDDKARLEKVRAKVSAMPADREPAPYVPDSQKPESAPKQSHVGIFGVPITDQRGVAREIASITENAKNASRIRTESTARKRIKDIDKSIEVLKKLQDDKDSPMTARQRRDADTAIKYVQDVKDGLAKRFGDSAPKGTGRFAPKETPSTPSRTYDERPGDPGDASFRRGASRLRQAGIEDFQPNDARRLDDMTASEQSAAIDRLKAGESIADVLPGTAERQRAQAEQSTNRVTEDAARSQKNREAREAAEAEQKYGNTAMLINSNQALLKKIVELGRSGKNPYPHLSEVRERLAEIDNRLSWTNDELGGYHLGKGKAESDERAAQLRANLTDQKNKYEKAVALIESQSKPEGNLKPAPSTPEPFSRRLSIGNNVIMERNGQREPGRVTGLGPGYARVTFADGTTKDYDPTNGVPLDGQGPNIRKRTYEESGPLNAQERAQEEAVSALARQRGEALREASEAMSEVDFSDSSPEGEARLQAAWDRIKAAQDATYAFNREVDGTNLTTTQRSRLSNTDLSTSGRNSTAGLLLQRLNGIQNRRAPIVKAERERRLKEAEAAGDTLTAIAITKELEAAEMSNALGQSARRQEIKRNWDRRRDQIRKAAEQRTAQPEPSGATGSAQPTRLPSVDSTLTLARTQIGKARRVRTERSAQDAINTLNNTESSLKRDLARSGDRMTSEQRDEVQRTLQAITEARRKAEEKTPVERRTTIRPSDLPALNERNSQNRDYREVARNRATSEAMGVFDSLPTSIPGGKTYGPPALDRDALANMDDAPSVPALNRAIRTLEEQEDTTVDDEIRVLKEARDYLKERADQDRAEFEAANTSLFGADFNIPERPVVAPLSMRRAEAPSSAPQGRVLNMRAINEDTAKVSAARRAHQRAATAQERAQALQGAPATLASLDNHVNTLYEAVNSPRLTDAQRERVQSQITSVETARRDLRDMIDGFEMERSRSQANGTRVVSVDDDMDKVQEHLTAIRATQDYRTALSEMRRLRALERRLQAFAENNDAGVSHVQIAEAQSLLTRIATIRAESNSRFAADIARAQSARV